jgi:hypothetical protein
LTPSLTHVISDDDRRIVVDVTSTDSHLFVLRNPSQQHIQVYDTMTFKQQGTLQVKNLSDDTSASGLITCLTYKCVYVSDTRKDIVYKIDLSCNNQVFSWHVDRIPLGLSINTDCNLLVACCWAIKIQEYTTSGSLVREICLELNDVKLSPWHAIQLTSNQFVVSCWNETNDEYDVVEVDTKGRNFVSYTKQLQSTTHCKFNVPRRLSLGKNNDSILVADYENDRIVILNRSLNCAHELNMMSEDDGFKLPTCIYFDESHNRLFVGEFDGQCRVFVLDDVI